MMMGSGESPPDPSFLASLTLDPAEFQETR